MIALPIPHSSFSFFKTKSRPGYKWVSALHSKSGTNVGPKAWHLLSPSSSHGWGVEWIRIFYLVATVCVWSKTPQNQCKAPVTPVSFGTGLLWPGAPVRVHLRALRDKGWCQAVAPKDNMPTLCCFQTDPLGKIYRTFALQGCSSSSLGGPQPEAEGVNVFLIGFIYLPSNNVLTTALLNDWSQHAGI